ncbi:MAG: hypothetical protein LBE83_02275, partial [Propionibacteriaceae bacterium]|nr:hypothetical protein [Propionibacteriaceae bacterium]
YPYFATSVTNTTTSLDFGSDYGWGPRTIYVVQTNAPGTYNSGWTISSNANCVKARIASYPTQWSGKTAYEVTIEMNNPSLLDKNMTVTVNTGTGYATLNINYRF